MKAEVTVKHTSISFPDRRLVQFFFQAPIPKLDLQSSALRVFLPYNGFASMHYQQICHSDANFGTVALKRLATPELSRGPSPCTLIRSEFLTFMHPGMFINCKSGLFHEVVFDSRFESNCQVTEHGFSKICPSGYATNALSYHPCCPLCSGLFRYRISADNLRHFSKQRSDLRRTDSSNHGV